jgi:glycosyltransferase involved in cell wall biosynthesis
MKIGIDAREIQGGVYTGIGRALYDFIRYVEKTPGEDTLVLFSAKPLPFSFSDKVQLCVMKEVWTLWWDQVQLASAMARTKVDVLYSPYYKIPLLSRCPKVSAILDLIYLEYPQYRQKLSAFARMYYKIFGPCYAAAARKVHTCSKFSCDDVVRNYGVDPDKIEVVPLAVSSVYCPRELVDTERVTAMKKMFGILHPYVLYTGNFKPHKNVAALIQAFGLLAREYKELDLVLVGPKMSGHLAWVRLCQQIGIEGRVIFTDKVADENVSRLLYIGAEVFVMPSLYEGFGLPPAEAMACGTPVVCSRASSLPEVVGDAAVLVDAARPQEIADGIKRILSDEDFKKERIAQGLRQVEKFREEKVMPRVLELLKQAAA